MEDLLNAVSTVGFPIAVACYTLYMNYKIQKEKSEDQLEATLKHTEVLTELKVLIESLVK